MIKLGLVIQGPTRSKGLTPLGWAAHADGLPVTDRLPHVADYDIWPNLRRMIEARGSQFERIVLVTWEGQQTQPVDRLEILALPVVRDEPDQRQKLKKGLGLPVNKHRQFLTSRVGIEHLRDSGAVDAILRIRSDIVVDLPRIAEWMRIELAKPDGEHAVYVPSLGFPELGATDFFFLGRVRPMATLFAGLCADPERECMSSVHADLLLRPRMTAASAGGREHEQAISNAAFPITLHHELMPESTRALLASTIGKTLRVLPGWMSETMEWRGFPMGGAVIAKVLPNHIFADAFEPFLVKLRSKRKVHRLRFLLDRAFDRNARQRWHRKSSAFARASTFVSRAIVALAR